MAQMAIVMNLEEDNVGCILLGPTAGIKEGQSVKRTHRIASIRVNDNFLGRVVNPLGQAIDGKGEIDLSDAFEMPLDRKAPGVIYRQPVKEPLQTGLKGVDSMILSDVVSVNLSLATVRRVRPLLLLIRSLIRKTFTRKENPYIVFMLQLVRRHLQLLTLYKHCVIMVHCLILLL